MSCPQLKNKLFLIYGGGKVLMFILYVCQDVTFYMRGQGDPLKCLFYLYLHDIIQTYQEALYVFALSLIKDRVIILETKIRKMDNNDFKNMRLLIYALMELKNNFQLINTYFSMPLLIKLTNNFISFLLSANVILNSKNKGDLSVFDILFSSEWFLILIFDIILLFYCVDRLLTAVSST